MIKLYGRKGCHSSIKAITWLKKHNLKINKISISKISRDDLITVLSFTEKGIDGVVKHTSKSGSEIKDKLNKLQEMNFNAAIEYIQLNPDLLHTPIVLEGDRCLVGYNGEEIRQFLPVSYRSRKYYSK